MAEPSAAVLDSAAGEELDASAGSCGKELVRAAAKEGVDVAVAVEGILRDDENEDRDRAAINASYQLLQDHVTKVGTEDADTFALALLARAYCNTCPHCSPFPGDPRRGRRYLNIGA